MVARGRIIDHELIVACFNGVERDLGDERSHGHLDVELDHVGNWVELDVHNFIPHGHEAEEHYLQRIVSGVWGGWEGATDVHSYGENHELCVEAYERCIFRKAMVVDKSFLDGVEEEVVQTRVDNEDNYFGGSIPILIDCDETILLVEGDGEEETRRTEE